MPGPPKRKIYIPRHPPALTRPFSCGNPDRRPYVSIFLVTSATATHSSLPYIWSPLFLSLSFIRLRGKQYFCCLPFLPLRPRILLLRLRVPLPKQHKKPLLFLASISTFSGSRERQRTLDLGIKKLPAKPQSRPHFLRCKPARQASETRCSPDCSRRFLSFCSASDLDLFDDDRTTDKITFIVDLEIVAHLRV